MIKRLMLVALVLVVGFVLLDATVLAQDQRTIVDQLGNNTGGDGRFGLPANEPTDATLRNALQTVFLAAGAVSVIFVAVGGLRYVLSEGNDQKIAQAKSTILYAIIGLIISISAFAIVSFVLRGIL